MYIMNFIFYGCGLVLLATLTTGQQRISNECTTSEWFGCLLSPCYFASCPLYPDAICSVETKSCGGCRAVWTVGGQIVDCKKRSICPPNVVEMTNCANNLCRDPFCPDYPRATCVPDICGHCEEDYYQDGIRVDCIGSFREQLRQLRLMMRGQSSTSSSGPSNSISLFRNNPQRITPTVQTAPVPSNSPTNIDPVVQSPVLDLNGENPNVQNPDMIGNVNEASQFSSSTKSPIEIVPIETTLLIQSNSPVVGPIDTPAATVPQRSNTPVDISLNLGASQSELNPAPSANASPFDMFRVGGMNEPAPGSPVTPEINPEHTEGFNAFAEFGIANAVPQTTADGLIPENNPKPVEPINPFAAFALDGTNEAQPNTQAFGGPNEPIENTQDIVPQNSRALITQQQNQLPGATNVEIPPRSNVELQINSQTSSPIIPPKDSQTPFQVSACVKGYVRRNCTENACAGQTCHIPGARCFESNCGSCRAEWYLDGRSVDCSDACPQNTITSICTNPCSYMSCPAHPNAICRVNKCGICTAEFFVNNEQVSCDIPSTRCPAGQEPQGCVCFSKICPLDSQARCRIVGCGRDCKIQYYKAGINGTEEVSCGWYSRKRT